VPLDYKRLHRRIIIMSQSFMQRRTSQKFYRTAEELKSPEESKIIGTLPRWFQGTYMRNGPGKFDFKDGFSVNHWFDGLVF